MKINLSMPSLDDLQNAYNKLNSGQLLPLADLLKYTQWTRFDSRLLEIVANYFAKKYKEINPFALAEVNQKQAWPACLGVVTAHSRFLVKDMKSFAKWQSLVMESVKPVRGEVYFLGLFDFQMKRVLSILKRPSKLFLKWGFWHDEICLNKSEKLEKTVIKKRVRLKFLKDFIKQNAEFSVEDYRRALNYQISSRQAQRDLLEVKKLRKKGNTQARRYVTS